MLDQLIEDILRKIDEARTIAVYCYRCKRLVPVEHPCEPRAFTNLELFALKLLRKAKIKARVVRL